jgi:general stress protein YciG
VDAYKRLLMLRGDGRLARTEAELLHNVTETTHRATGALTTGMARFRTHAKDVHAMAEQPGKSNPDNFVLDRERASRAGRVGGEHSPAISPTTVGVPRKPAARVAATVMLMGSMTSTVKQTKGRCRFQEPPKAP